MTDSDIYPSPLPIDIEEEMRASYLDYAMSVIIGRALPDVRDGLKPVQRRILHSLKEKDDGRYNKVANVVGHTMQYHPHGDASIADALVNLMCQRCLHAPSDRERPRSCLPCNICSLQLAQLRLQKIILVSRRIQLALRQLPPGRHHRFHLSNGVFRSMFGAFASAIVGFAGVGQFLVPVKSVVTREVT